MTSSDPYTFIKAILAKDFEAERHARKHTVPEPRVITVSRDYGAGGETIAKQLSECLSVPLYDREILDLVAAKAKVERFKFEPHDENVSAGVSTFLYSVLTGRAGELQTYRRYLYEVILELSRKDCILVGRGAHLILEGKKVFRLCIVGSEPVCARRIAGELGIPPDEAERKVAEFNENRRQYIEGLYGDGFHSSYLKRPENFDLILNTDHIAPADALPIVLLALQRVGFCLEQYTPSPDKGP